MSRRTCVLDNGDVVLTASALVNCRHVQNAVSVHLKSHLNNRLTSRSRWNSIQRKLAENVIVLEHNSLALVDPDRHVGLVVPGSRVRLRLFCRNRCVAFDDRRHLSPDQISPKRQWSHVQQQQVLYGFRLVSM